MEKYERSISLKTIYLTLVRRAEAVLGIFVVLAAGSYAVTNFMMAKSYVSTATMNYETANHAAMTQAIYSDIQNKVNNSSTFASVAANLETANITHSNGTAISASEIKSGLTFSTFATNMVSFTITFKTADASIAQEVLTQYSAVALDILVPTYAGLKLSSDGVSTPVDTSNTSRNLLIGIVISLVVALAVPFIYEIANDTVYDKKDIESWGAPAFEVRASMKK